MKFVCPSVDGDEFFLLHLHDLQHGDMCDAGNRIIKR